MKLTIGSNVPDWWVDERPQTISQWWDGLEWQPYEVPNIGECGQTNLIDGATCLFDSLRYSTMDSVWLGDIYKMAGHVESEVGAGIVREINNVMDMVSLWIF